MQKSSIVITILLTNVGASTYQLIKSLALPQGVMNFTFQELVDKVKVVSSVVFETSLFSVHYLRSPSSCTYDAALDAALAAETAKWDSQRLQDRGKPEGPPAGEVHVHSQRIQVFKAVASR